MPLDPQSHWSRLPIFYFVMLLIPGTVMFGQQAQSKVSTRAYLDKDGTIREVVTTKGTNTFPVVIQEPAQSLLVELVKRIPEGVKSSSFINDVRLLQRESRGSGPLEFSATGFQTLTSATSPFITGNFHNVKLKQTVGLPGSKIDISKLDAPFPFAGRCWSRNGPGNEESLILVLTDRIVGVNVATAMPIAAGPPIQCPGGSKSARSKQE